MNSFERPFVARLEQRLAEPAPLMQILVGPRQVGKTMGVRQLLARWSGAWHYASADDLLAADRSWLLAQWQTASRMGEGALLVIDEVQKAPNWTETVKSLWDAAPGCLRVVLLGSSALMLAGVMQRRFATGDTRYDELARSLARGLLALQLPDGAFLNRWNTAANSPVPGERSKYATGEAFWALTLMHRAFPGEGWDRPARLTADYLALHRDDVEQQKYPPWADQWAATSNAHRSPTRPRRRTARPR